MAIEVARLDVTDGDRDDCDINAEIAAGRCVVLYEFDWRTATERYGRLYPGADCWYTERNGDPITCLAPKGTPVEQLPADAKGYLIMRWATPEEF